MGFKYLFYFGFGHTGIAIVNIVVQTWILFFFAPGQGRELIPAAVIGSILFFGRIVDAVADPLIGNWSDRLQSKNGRRMPFLIYSSLPLALIMFLIFFEPIFQFVPILRIIILSILLGLFYFLFTAFASPYLGMIPDLSPHRKDRANLSTSVAIFNLIGTGLALIGAPVLIQYFSPQKKGFFAEAYIPAMGILAGVAFFSFVVLIIGMFPLRHRGETAVSTTMFQSVKQVFRNKPFVLYLFGMNIYWGSFFIINVSVPYYVTVLMGKEIGFQSLALGITFGVAAISFPIVNKLIKVLGNRLVAMYASGVMAVTIFLVYFIPNAPFGLAPDVFGIILMGLAGFPIAVLFIVPNAMVAELSDYRLPDGSKPGEAIYFGVQGLFMKFFIGLVAVLTSLLFDIFGKSPDNPLGIQLTGPLVSIFAVISMAILYFYPDDRLGLFKKEVK